MKVEELKNPLESLAGVGKSKALLFAKLNVHTVADLLTFYPRDYEDRRKTLLLKDFQMGKVHTLAKVIRQEWFGYGKMKTLKLIIADPSGQASLICFSRPFMQKQYPVGSQIIVTGNFQVKYGELQSSSFEIVKAESVSQETSSKKALTDAKIYPIYHLTEGLTQLQVRKIVNQALKTYNRGLSSSLPERIIRERKLLSKSEALWKIHQPESPEDIKKAHDTIVFEEFFNFQTALARRALKHKGYLPGTDNPSVTQKNSISGKATASPAASYSLASSSSTSVSSSTASTQTELLSSEGQMQALLIQEALSPANFSKELSPLQKKLYDSLPFDLSPDQKREILKINGEIDRGYMERNDIILGKKNAVNAFTMQRLLQGDVGSGKTLVAFFAALRAINWKGQCALMAPTEILARQHADTMARLLEPLGIRTAFLTGNIKASGRTALLKALKAGEIDIVCGTHALFSQDVVYSDLQLAIIDEQHRFGVLQREAIISKGRNVFEPHLLMMSATPIPQSLALTVYGDLDISLIKTLPSGRKPVKTYLVREGHEMNAYQAVRKELASGHQAYFVYPAIESDTEGNQLKNAVNAFENLSKNIYPEYRAALLHSKVSEEEQIQILKDFRVGKIQILAATTVIEVGVDVPNATSIVIEGADHFGLAQLHQLRGRVGRGADQAFCYLIYSEKITENGIQRMKVLRESTDGFLISEEDLKLRGPGELNGKMQSGELNLGLADFEKDKDLLQKARYDAFNFVRTPVPGMQK
ncbi:MAG: ATP-dependent DNA helicase RecG [Treponema sp.]|nr:ATP-dependent DNA helicase RecG [Treponema sp.]